jgi:DNA-binding NtrC family response regulator
MPREDDLLLRERDLLVQLLSRSYTRDPEAVLDEALRIAVERTEADQGYIAVYDLGQTDLTRPRWWRGHRLDDAEVLSLQRSTADSRPGAAASVIGHALRNPGQVHRFEAWRDARFNLSESARDPMVRSILTAAIGQEPLAVMYLYRLEGRGEFSDHDIRFIEQYRAFLSPVVDRLLTDATAQDDPTTPYRRGGHFAAISGRSRPIAELLRRATIAARSDQNLLITGAVGSGKTTLARAIHDASPRAGRPFVHVNCGALVPELFSFELFGRTANVNVRDDKRDGFVQEAAGGTLFLDEVTETRPNNQAALLQLLENRRFHRIGASRPTDVDVRIICATNRAPREAVSQGVLRADLYDRISAIELQVPGLQDRIDDIPLLMADHGKRYSRRRDMSWLGYTNRAIAFCMARAWGGSVRKLLQAVERGVEAAESLVPIDVEHLFPDEAPEVPAAGRIAMYTSLKWEDALKAFRSAYFRHLYTECRGNMPSLIERSGWGRAYAFELRKLLLAAEE